MKNKREWFLEEHKDLPILIQIILEQFQMNALKILEAIILLYCAFRFDLCSVSSGRSHFWYWNK